MKSVGIVREVDNLGRVVLPAEMRSVLKIGTGDPLEFFIEEQTGLICMRKYDGGVCLFCGNNGQLVRFKGRPVCIACMRSAQDPLLQFRPNHESRVNIGPAKPETRKRRKNIILLLKEARERHPTATQKQLAAMVGISQGRVSQLLRTMAYQKRE